MDEGVVRFLFVAIGIAIMGGGIPAIIILTDRLGKAFATRMGGKRPTDDQIAGLEQQLQLARERLAGAEERMAASEQRLVELEERLDFAERLLARVPDRERLPPQAH